MAHRRCLQFNNNSKIYCYRYDFIDLGGSSYFTLTTSFKFLK